MEVKLNNTKKERNDIINAFFSELTAAASVSNTVGTPSVSVTVADSGNSKKLTFAFTNIKGATGATGASGISAQSLGSNGYIKFSNGIIINWGRGTTDSGGYKASTTFPLAFTTSNISVVVNTSTTSDTSSYNVSYNVYQKAATYFGLKVSSAKAVPFDYIAIGY